MKNDTNPMQSAHDAPRCTAKSKRSGVRCKNPAVLGWSVCRMHGARGGHRSGETHPTWVHGARSHNATEVRSVVSGLARFAKSLLDD